MSETTCLTCRDLKRQYGWACQDLRDAAKKLVRSGGEKKFAERVRDAKFRKAEVAKELNMHAEQSHETKGATA